MKIKEKCDYSFEKAWIMLDNKKIGVFAQEELRDALVKLNILIDKTGLAFVFNFIDTNKDGKVNYFEFMEFWQYNPTLFDQLD